MASKKEFEMLFALNVRMNGGFSSTFSKAQAEFTRLGKEIQGLHRVQGDIASYQKQQSAIEATRSKLGSLQKQHDLLQKEIKETEGSTAGLEREKVKLEERIKNTEAALERQNQKLETTGARLKDAGVDTADLAKKDAELTAKIKELETAQDNAAESAASFGEKASQGVTAVGDALAAAGIAIAMREVMDAFVECVGVAADFEETMSGVQAISGAAAEEMALLANKAKEMGASTKFTAKEAGDAMGYPQILTLVTIQNIYKGDLVVGDMIEVIEASGQKGTVLGGIPALNSEHEYILFLTEHNNSYYPVGAYQGRFILREGYLFQQATRDVKLESYSPLLFSDFENEIVSLISISDKGSAPASYPDTTIVPGFDLDEPNKPDTP